MDFGDAAARAAGAAGPAAAAAAAARGHRHQSDGGLKKVIDGGHRAKN